MEGLFDDNIQCLANVVWATATSVKNEDLEDEEVFLEFRNQIEEVFISAIYSWDGIHVKVEHFYDGLLVTMASKSGINYEDLVDFLEDIFMDDRTAEPFVFPKVKTVLTYGEYVGDPTSLRSITGKSISSFSEFLENEEIDEILSEIPEIALHERAA